MSQRQTERVGQLAVEKPRHVLLDLTRSGPYFAALLFLALLAFWPTYLSQLDAQRVPIHLHAVLATVWLLMLVVQPILIQQRRRDWHRALGRLSYGLAPLIVISVVLLSHSRVAGITGDPSPVRAYVLYIQISAAMLFGLCYGLAILTRRNMAYHARFMIATSFTLIDPIVVRLMVWIDNTPSWNYNLFTFGLTDLVIVTLIWFDHEARQARWVFPFLLVLFVVSQLLVFFEWTDGPMWMAFARWFAALPLT